MSEQAFGVGDVAAGAKTVGAAAVTVTTPGSYQVVVLTDRDDDIFENNSAGHLAAEQNNSATTTFDATVDLVIENLSLFPTDAHPGDTVTISWDTRNTGNIAAEDLFQDHVQVTRLESIPESLSRFVITDQRVSHDAPPLGPGEVRQSSISVILPTGINGIGEIEVIVTADRNNSVIEYAPSLDAEQK